MRLLSLLLFLTLFTCREQQVYSLTLRTSEVKISSIEISIFDKPINLDFLTPNSPTTLGNLYGDPPEQFTLTWIDSYGNKKQCLLIIKDKHPENFNFKRDGYIIDINENGAKLKFKIWEKEFFNREVGEIECAQ